MKVSFSSFCNLAISSFKNNAITFLTDRQKFISAIAIAILATLTIGYIIYKRRLLATKLDSLKQPQDDNIKAANPQQQQKNHDAKEVISSKQTKEIDTKAKEALSPKQTKESDIKDKEKLSPKPPKCIYTLDGGKCFSDDIKAKKEHSPEQPKESDIKGKKEHSPEQPKESDIKGKKEHSPEQPKESDIKGKKEHSPEQPKESGIKGTRAFANATKESDIKGKKEHSPEQPKESDIKGKEEPSPKQPKESDIKGKEEPSPKQPKESDIKGKEEPSPKQPKESDSKGKEELSPKQPKESDIKAEEDVSPKKPRGVDIKVKDKNLKDADLIRIAYQNLSILGVDKSKWLSEGKMNDLAQKLRDCIAQRTYQAGYNNRNISVFYVDFNDFGRANGVYDTDLQAVIRYLILKGDVFSYCRGARVGFCLYLDQAAHDAEKGNFSYTKQRLELGDAAVESLIFPPLDVYSSIKTSVINDIVQKVKAYHYDRAINKEPKPASFNLNIPIIYSSSLSQLPQFMDELVSYRLIDSWNIYQRMNHITVKLHDSDLVDTEIEYRWDVWRNQTKIEQEALFRKENCVNISTQALDASTLTDNQGEALIKLVEDLNRRTEPGVFNHTIGNYKDREILNFLKSQNAIFDYQHSGWGDAFEIFVKNTDKNSAALLG